MGSFNRIPPVVAGEKVVEKRDYEKRKSWDLISGKERALELPRSKVLYYRLENGAWFCIRPSGTEPKIKIYFSVYGGSAAVADSTLSSLKEEVLALAEIKPG